METDLSRIKQIILGDEYEELLKLRDEINDDGKFSKIVSNIITEALKERSLKDDSIAEVLAPTIDQAISSSISQDPKKLAESLYPIMGPAIRKSISETMQQMLENLNQLLEESLSPKSLRWRFDAWRTGKSYSELVLLNTLEYSVEQVFLIHRESSLLIHHQYSELADTRDPDMVSGMFSAIQDFIEDSFSTKEGDELDTLKLGDLSVVLQRGPSAVLAAVVRGRIPEDLRNDLSRTLENLHRMKKAELANYGGDPDVFADVEDDLRKILMSERKEPEEKSIPWLAVVTILVILAGVGYWNYLSYQESLERTQMLTTLEQEPGLVLLDSKYSDKVLHISLLVDPNARSPEEVISTSQESFSIEFTEHSHLSLIDELVAKRAINLLQPTVETQLVVANSILVLSGRADGDWMRDFASRWPAVTGLTAIDTDALELVYPRREAMAAAVQAIEATELNFENGETETEMSSQFIAALTDQITELNALSMEEYGRPVQIDVVGYTDDSGSPSFNQQVGFERALRFEQVLVDAGVDASLLESFSAFDHSSNEGTARRITRLIVAPLTR